MKPQRLPFALFFRNGYTVLPETSPKAGNATLPPIDHEIETIQRRHSYTRKFDKIEEVAILDLDFAK
jgi:hypothetical protein